MEVAQLEEALRVIDYSLSQIKWRLKSASKRRLQTDVLALCTGMRPVVMVDYGGKMPELQERLCAFLKLSQKESSIFEHLRVMVIEDMIYLIHVTGLSELVKISLHSETELQFVDLEQDPPKMISQAEKSSLIMELISVQKLFSLVFPANGKNDHLLPCHNIDSKNNATSSIIEQSTPSSEFIDLSSCMHDTQVTVPTLNGWLLDYPVIYLFGKDHISDAIYNLSTKSLHLFKILVCRNGTSSKGSCQEELTRLAELLGGYDLNKIINLAVSVYLLNRPKFGSFSVPFDLSKEGGNEPWAEAFLARMQARWERCKQVWTSLEMEVSGCYPQAIVL